MSDMNSTHNRVVWLDIPVADLDRAAVFYRAMLGIEVHRQDFEGFSFCVFAHGEGNGGCLVLKPENVSSNAGILVYMNVDGRIRDASTQVETLGGKVLQPVHEIGPHGFCAIVLDSEGNRLALHSTVDA
jgi:predicted enzyme related to lactoylglutathione lyase